MLREKRGGGLDVTRLRRSTNEKGSAHEGTFNMQRESLMLSRLRLNWKVILENHFPSLMGASFFVSTSRPCALYFQSPSSFLEQHLSPHPRQAGRIRPEG